MAVSIVTHVGLGLDQNQITALEQFIDQQIQNGLRQGNTPIVQGGRALTWRWLSHEGGIDYVAVP